ncbi:hypothetical protein TRIP_C60031 [Candidatus Zixiibacteriota bacterium]|nr:hypothetical protein TRIP_C60031 [candidate division Zixibacteria bacterium]
MAHCIRSIMQQVLSRTKAEAGPRYLPGLKPHFPSLPIRPLIVATNGLALNEEFWDKLASFRGELAIIHEVNAFISNSNTLPSTLRKQRQQYWRIFKICLESIENSLQAKGSFSKLDFQKIPKLIAVLQATSNAVSNYVYKRQDDLGPRESLKTQDQVKESQFLENILRHNNDLYDTIHNLTEFAQSATVGLSNHPYALLIGPAGSGKTHFLCDLAEHRLSSNKPTLVLLARDIQINNNDFWDSIARAIPGGYTKFQLKKMLCREARNSRERALIFIDAINEADRTVWKRLISVLLDDGQFNPEIGIVLSCRIPFQELMLPKKIQSKFIKLYHPGFGGIEFQAQKVIFEAYDLPLPEVPLLSDEFSNPLFLISFCETLNETSIKRRHRQIGEISSGQKGMTKILEDFLKRKQRHITKSIKSEIGKDVFLTPNWLWSSGRMKGLAKDVSSVMAKRYEKYALVNELEGIIRLYVIEKKYAKKVKTLLLAEGIFIETIVWDRNRPIEAVAFNYQKFSDHLIARYLLENVDRNDNASLLQLFKQCKNDSGLLEAIMIEIPQRFGKELLLMIPEGEVTISAMRAFIAGLYWRDSYCFNRQTNELVGWILSQPELNVEIHEALVSLATKINHPYNADCLHKYLIKYSLVDRDLKWTEFLRHCSPSSAPMKLVDWLLEFDLNKLPTDLAANYLNILAWILTTTRRGLRDRATKALVLLGTVFASQIGKLTIESLDLNDPYVSERMLAALYGVWMRRLPSIVLGYSDPEILCQTALNIYGEMFLPDSRYNTTHVLARDYARRVILCAIRVKPDLLTLEQLKRITPPFSYGGIRDWGVSRDKDEGKYRNGNGPMQMDFSNYTLGRLVQNRQNYDFNHEDYKKVKNNIFWRIYQLGYKLEHFGTIDSEIASMRYWPERHNAEIIERYGKKYCWIAYFELYGYLQDNKLLDELDMDDTSIRPSDCDIDPSFPKAPHNEPVYTKDHLGDRKISTSRWIINAKAPNLDRFMICEKIYGYAGPWVLLNGYIRQEDIATKRNLDIWVHTCCINQDELPILLNLPHYKEQSAREFASLEYSYYTFAGEIPWANTWPCAKYNTISFEGNYEKAEKSKKQFIMYKQGRRLSDEESESIFAELVQRFTEDSSFQEMAKYLKGEGLRIGVKHVAKIARQRRLIQIRAVFPIYNYLWESYHSDINESINLVLPSKIICEFLGLHMMIPSWDFNDPKGNKAVIVIKARGNFKAGHDATYIRKDLLERFLNIHNYHLIWSISGDRRPLYKDDEGRFREPSKRENVRSSFHRILIHSNGRCKIL